MDAEYAQARAEREYIRTMIEGFSGLMQDVLTEMRVLRQREDAREAAAERLTGLAAAGGHGIPQPRRRGTGRPFRIVGKSG